MLGETNASWTERRRGDTRDAILTAAWEVAREVGIGALTLREVAMRVGMRAPSLYTHFDSKHAIYDAMFGQAWTEYLVAVADMEVPSQPRPALRLVARTFFDFATADLARHQLMNVRVVPDFSPSPESYAPAVQVMADLVGLLEGIGLDPTEEDVDLFVAIVGGLIDSQWSNDPGGTRYARLLDRAVDMYADDLGLPEDTS
jgi:AcrR family transcriptional regulator